jgi:hypothetical protein
LTSTGADFLKALHDCRHKVEDEIAHVIGEEKLQNLHSILGDLMVYFDSDVSMDQENDSLASTKLN